ncbi:MAG: phage shock protein operon transcriptional activator [Rhodospirillaceae bacterium]|nr:phage shock protein operon transcriptional activator [Rhodospirillaceae bacterium]
MGESTVFLAHLDHLSRVAPVDRPVLIIGERGTGKELSAARVHFLSRRWSGPFIKFNCAALPESLLEAELFGVEPGAFTGAAKRRQGRFELADGGTLFLDEIGNAGLAVQEKVLRAIEYGEFERLGGTDTLKVSVRVVAATNRDLPSEAEAGRFREDLLDRLAFDVLTLPPLRARSGDVMLLADHFGREMAGDLGWKAFPGFTAAAQAMLDAYRWPGNVRELKNVVERAVAHWPEEAKAIDRVQFDPFESPFRPTHAPGVKRENGGTETIAVAAAVVHATQALPDDFKSAVAAFESDLLARALGEARHNQRVAARRLGLGYHQFRNTLRKHNLLPARDRGDL